MFKRAYLILILCVVVIGTSLGASKRTLHSGRNVAMMKENNANDRRRHMAVETLRDYLTHIQTRDASYSTTCSPNCDACIGDTCLHCSKLYGLDNEGKCQACPENCRNCYGEKGNQRCAWCKMGYALVDYQCTETCTPHCIECGYDTSICIKRCQPGYEKTPEGQCVACSNLPCSCPDYCDFCTMEGECKRCDRGQGQGLDFEGNACHKCPENCRNCRGEPGIAKQICISCDDGYALVDNQCIEPCPQHCSLCGTDPSWCVWGCEEGYGLTLGGQCKPCSPNCEDCRKADVCEYCADDYGFVEEGQAVCQRCLTEDCRRCDDERTSCWMYDYEHESTD